MSFTTLIEAEDLAAHLQDPGWVVLDCRHDLADHAAGRRAFDAGHIPGAQFAAVETELSDKSPGPQGEFRGRHPLPTPEAFIATLRRWGVNEDSQVVAYDAQGGMYAARLWWMLRWIGHDAVAVLNGGLPAWIATGLPLSIDSSAKPAGTISKKPSLVRAVSVDDLLGDASLQVIDARAPELICTNLREKESAKT